MRNKYVNFIRNKSQNIFCMAILLFVFFSCLYQSNSYASKFSLYDKVEVYNTSGIGLNLRSGNGTSYSVKTIMADGTQMTVYGGPYEADGYTWWYLYGYVNGIYDSTGYYYSPGYYYGYAAEDWLKAVSTSCTYSLSSSSKSVGYSGGSSYSVSVTTSSGCSWTASSNASNASWITITSGSSGSGNGTVYYSVSANTSTSSRTGTMTIAGNTFTVTQEGEVISCTDSYEPNDSSSTAYGHLSSGSSYSGKICTSSDVDWFKVNVTSAGTISLSLTVPSSKDYYVELYSPSYSWVAGNHDVSISYNATTTGNYYIRVLGYNGSYNTTSSYTLTYTFTPSSTSKSDLVIQNLSISPTSGNAGSSATVSFKIYNQGSGSASSSTTNIRISSSSGDVYTSDTLLASLSTSSISSGGSSSVSQTVTIPSSLSSGTYYVWVTLDVNSTANQSDEDNDKSYTSFTVTTSTSSKSDLVIQNLSVSPTSGKAGSSATVSFKIYNQGSGSANSSTTNIRISSSSGNVYTSDTLLASISTSSISSGSSSSVNQTVTIPSSLSSGTYYVWVTLDVNSTANQSDEDNDKSYTSFTVTTSTSSKSDLVIQNLSVSPTSGNAGSSATVSFKIYNQGSGSSNSSITSIRINSSSGSVSTSDTLLTSISTSSISSGGSSSVSQTVTIPSSLSSGTYYVWVTLDVNSTANQSDEDNDKSYTSFKVTTSTSSKSDLVIQNLSVSPTSGNAGSSATVSFKIYNQGSGSSNSSTTSIRINSSSGSVSTSDTLLTSISTSSISSGGSSSVSQTVTIPGSLSSGTYYIWVILDENSTANQSDKSNDKSYTSFTVTLPASSKSDLVIDDLSVSPTSGEAGTTATVSFTIRNQGDGDADSSTANIRINTSSSKVTTSNTLLESLYIPEITAGGTHSDNQSITIPKDSKDATHYIWMILDVNNTVNQSDVSNDKDYTEFVVTTKKTTPTPTPTSCTDDYEPNDSSSTAYGPLNSGLSYSGKICSDSDEDWFMVNITAEGTISVNLTVPSTNDYYMELYDPSYMWVAGYASGDTGESESISYYATTAGNYYIRVLGYGASYNTTDSYTLTYTLENQYDLEQTLEEFESALIKKIDRIVENYALGSGHHADMVANTPWWRELIRVLLASINFVLDVVNKVVDVVEGFFTPEGSAEVASDASKLGQAINGLKDGKEIGANASFFTGIAGFFRDIEDFKIFTAKGGDFMVESDNKYQEEGILEFWDFVINVLNEGEYGTMLVPERSGPLQENGRYENFKWATGVKEVKEDIENKFNQLINEIPKDLPQDFSMSEVISYVEELEDKLRVNNDSIVPVRFYSSQDGETYESRSVYLGQSSQYLSQMSLQQNAFLKGLDVKYRETWEQAIETELGVVKAYVRQVEVGGIVKKVVKVAEDAITIKKVAELPQQVVELYNEKKEDPMDVSFNLRMLVLWDLAEEVARAWAIADGVAGVPKEGKENRFEGGFIRYLLNGGEFPKDVN